MKSPKSLALLTLSLACGSLFGANHPNSLVATNSTILHPSWTQRIYGAAIPVAAGGAFLGAVAYANYKGADTKKALKNFSPIAALATLGGLYYDNNREDIEDSLLFDGDLLENLLHPTLSTPDLSAQKLEQRCYKQGMLFGSALTALATTATIAWAWFSN